MKTGYKKAVIIVLAAAMSMFMVSCGNSGSNQGGNNADNTPVQTDSQSQNSGVSQDGGGAQHGSGHHGEHGNYDKGCGGSSCISEAQARQIALAKVPGASDADIRKMETEWDDGRMEYEGSIFYNGYEYEFEIDGQTGNIIKWEIDD